MKTFFILVLTALLLHPGATPATKPANLENGMTTYYFIRHAEKDTSDSQNRDPKLSPEGRARAQRWAEIFKEVPFDLIYSTNYHRTRETATTIAETKDLELDYYDPSQMN